MSRWKTFLPAQLSNNKGRGTLFAEMYQQWLEEKRGSIAGREGAYLKGQPWLCDLITKWLLRNKWDFPIIHPLKENLLCPEKL